MAKDTAGIVGKVIAERHDKDGNLISRCEVDNLVNGKTAVLITGLTAGTWHIWARASSNPEFAILDCGYILLT